MIYDSLANIGRYRGIDKGLDRAIEDLLKMDIGALDAPRMELDGGNYLMVQTPMLKKRADTAYEAHRQYVDIQIGLVPGEVVEYLPIAQVEGWSEFDAERDVTLSADDQAGIALPLAPGCFAMFFPEDAHRPIIGEGQTRKIVVKVLL